MIGHDPGRRIWKPFGQGQTDHLHFLGDISSWETYPSPTLYVDVAVSHANPNPEIVEDSGGLYTLRVVKYPATRDVIVSHLDFFRSTPKPQNDNWDLLVNLQ